MQMMLSSMHRILSRGGANTPSYKQNEGTPTYDYRYKADVIDTQTSEEIWYDKSDSILLK